MSAQAQAVFIEYQEDSYSIIDEDIESPLFPDISYMCVFEIGESLKKALESLEAEDRVIVRDALVPLFAEAEYPMEVEVLDAEEWNIIGTFSKERCKNMSESLKDFDCDSLTSKITPIDDYPVSHIVMCLKDAIGSIHLAAKGDYGLAFLGDE